jgi:hypothetical protein
MNLLVSMELAGGEVGPGREALLLPILGQRVGMPDLLCPSTSCLSTETNKKQSYAGCRGQKPILL